MLLLYLINIILHINKNKMKKTIFAIAEKLKEELEQDGIQRLKVENSVLFLNKFFKHSYKAMDMIQVIIPRVEGEYQTDDGLTLRVLDLLEKIQNPHGWPIRLTLWDKIDTQMIMNWVIKNENTEDSIIHFSQVLAFVKNLNAWDDKELVETIFVYPFITSSYKNLCTIIDEYK